MEKLQLNELLTESKEPSLSPNPDRRITVRLNCNGVEKRSLLNTKEGKTKYYVRKAGQFIYGKQNLFKGAFGVVPPELDGFESTTDLPAFDVDNRLNVEWLVWWLKHGELYKSLISVAKGSATMRVHPEDFLKLEIPLPPREEQDRILDRLNQESMRVNSILSYIKGLESYCANLRSSILQDVIQGKLVKQEENDEHASIFLEKIKDEKEQLIKEKKIKKSKPLPEIAENEIPYELPKGWGIVGIEQLINSKRDIRTGPFGSTLSKSEHQLTGIPVWGIESIGKNGVFTYTNKIFISEMKAKALESFSVEAGDIIISRSGTVGELCVLPPDVKKGIISTNLMKISLNKEIIDPYFFCYLFKGSQLLLNTLNELCKGSTRLFLTQKILKALPFLLPPLKEQKRIIEKVDQLMTLCDELEQTVEQSKLESENLMKAVLQEALTVKEEVLN